MTISFHANCPRLAEVQQILRTDLVEFVRKQLAIYIRELKEEFSKGLILPTDRKPQVIISENKSIPSTTVKKSDFQSHIVCFFLFNFFIIRNFNASSVASAELFFCRNRKTFHKRFLPFKTLFSNSILNIYLNTF